ncbi:MAG: hypothetical protein MK085_01365 [Phycisphaerales bacterium]|nr:hypothetical protein [Phycisphaerales bacterium]
MSAKPTCLALATLLALGTFSLQGCQTWKGFGKDVSSLGDDIQGDKKSDGEAEESEEATN